MASNRAFKVADSLDKRFITTVAETKYLALDAIQLPVNSEIYQNTEEVKFIYEIYERIFLESHYSKMERGGSNNLSVYQTFAEIESNNLTYSIGGANYSLVQTLKNLQLNSSNYLATLKHIYPTRRTN